ncbi:MAG: aldo/keto reductase [Bacteroidota bacterium]
MTTATIGKNLKVNRLGFGTMRLTTGPGIWGDPSNKQQAIRIIQQAVELGANFFDTADSYGPGHSEMVVEEALRPFKDEVVLATKGGAMKYVPGRIMSNGHPYYLKKAAEASLLRLKREQIDLYFLHRVDPDIPIEESVGALADLQKEGKIQHIGISNVSVDQLHRAQKVAHIAAVQNAFNLADRRHEALVRETANQGIAFVAHTPVGVGRIPAEMAAKGMTASQASLVWLLQYADHVIPIPGTSNPLHLKQNMESLSLAEQPLA